MSQGRKGETVRWRGQLWTVVDEWNRYVDDESEEAMLTLRDYYGGEETTTAPALRVESALQ